MTTKADERKALEKIRKIVEALGNDSYVGTAFEGCFEIAEENINCDFAGSMKQRKEIAARRADEAEKKADEAQKSVSYYSAELDKAVEEIAELKRQLEAEQEWKPYVDKDNVKQEDYEHLIGDSFTKYMTEEEAKELLYNWFGFAKEKVTIYTSISKYEISRHRRLRKVGTIDRRPAYNSTDWNYIRFDCGSMCYELHNDNLRFYIQ